MGRPRNPEFTKPRPCASCGEPTNITHWYTSASGETYQRYSNRCSRCLYPRHPRPKLPTRSHWRTVRSIAQEVGICQKCGFVPEIPAQLEVDHIIPRFLGGPDDQSNLQVLCANCHRLKTYTERPIGERHGNSKLTVSKVKEIRARSARGESSYALGAEFGVDHTAIQDAVNKVTWKHVD